MNKKITKKFALLLGITAMLNSNAQVTTETFESFTLTPNSYYQNTTTPDWQTPEATFGYSWNSGGYWESGSSYTNIKDSVNATYTHLYNNITGGAYSGDNYVTVQDPAIIKIKHLSVLQGFYVTNTTFAWKAIKQGNMFSRKFGDTTGAHTGTSIPQGEYPDWFLLKVVGYVNGAAVNDTIKFYLADYRPAGTLNDYVIKNWQFVNCTALGIVDSVRFHLSSSDNTGGFMNTPSYFSMDNFTTSTTVGIHELTNVSNISLFPNPAADNLSISYTSQKENTLRITMVDITGKEVMQTEQQNTAGPNVIKLQTATLQAGVYFVDLNDGSSSKKIKFIKL